MGESGKPALPLFAIQLRKVDIGEVTYKCQGFSDSSISPTDTFDLNVAVSPYDELVEGERGQLQVTLSFSCSSQPPDSPLGYPYSLKMSLHGDFEIKDMKKIGMDASGIIRWAERNGALVLLPFLREAVYSFTQKTGFKPILIPLVETGAFKVEPPPAIRTESISPKQTAAARET